MRLNWVSYTVEVASLIDLPVHFRRSKVHIWLKEHMKSGHATTLWRPVPMSERATELTLSTPLYQQVGVLSTLHPFSYLYHLLAETWFHVPFHNSLSTKQSKINLSLPQACAKTYLNLFVVTVSWSSLPIPQEPFNKDKC